MNDCKCVVPCVNSKNSICGHCGGFFRGFPTEIDTPPMPKVKDPKTEGTIKTDRCLCVKPGYGGGDLAHCTKCGQEIDYDGLKPQSALPRKEVISIQPGDVITIKQDNPIEWLSFCVPDGQKTVTFPRGQFTLEVYREQVKDD